MAEEKSGFVKAVTNEGALFLYRLVTAGAAVVLTIYAHSINDGNAELLKKFSAFQLQIQDRIGSIEGQSLVLNSRLDAQAGHINGIDTDVRSLFQRLYDLGKTK